MGDVQGWCIVTAFDRTREAVRTAYPFPSDSPRVAFLARLATWDLWHGPVLRSELDDEDAAAWPGFGDACAELRAWADETLPREVWYDADCESLNTSEPEGWRDEETGEWHEPFLADTYRLEWREILAARFPLKLSEYL